MNFISVSTTPLSPSYDSFLPLTNSCNPSNKTTTPNGDFPKTPAYRAENMEYSENPLTGVEGFCEGFQNPPEKGIIPLATL
jgi:hypothetical protein